MEEGPTIQQSNTLIFVNEHLDAFRLIKSIIPYYEGKNAELKQELLAKSQIEQVTEDNKLLKLENKLELSTKYYNAQTNLYIIKYDDAIQAGVDAIIQTLEEKKLQFDSIFFTVTALGPKQIFGHDKYCQVVEKFSSAFEPQIQTLVYQKTDELQVDFDYILKQESELESFTESVYDDFKKLSESDIVIKPRAKSMLEETEGITRIIDILESNVWTGSEMLPQEKKQKEPSTTKLNIHLPTYEKNKDIREKYEQYAQEEDEEEEEILEKKSKLELQDSTANNDNQEQKEEKAQQAEKIEDQQLKNQVQQKDDKEIVDTQQNDAQSSNKSESDQKKDAVKEEPSREVKIEIKQEEESKEKIENKDTKEKIKKVQPKFENDDDDEVQESTLNDFVKILQQMKGMKENNVKLTDDQRKDQAEKFVLGLMEAFGIDEDSEEEK